MQTARFAATRRRAARLSALLVATALATAVLPGAASPSQAATARLSLTMPLYDAPGATVPVIVSVGPVARGTTATFTLGGGWCLTGSGATYAFPGSGGIYLGTECFYTLPGRTWKGYVSGSAELSAGSTTSTVSARAARSIHTMGYVTRSLSAAQINATERCGNTGSSVWLTFDDRIPSSATTRSLIAVLARNRVRAHFYLNGISSADRAALVKAGHIVQNHTKNHLALNTLTGSRIQSEVKGGPRPSARPYLMRPPYGAGAFARRVTDAVSPLGYGICRWTTDTKDWSDVSASVMGAKVRYGDAYTKPATAGGVVLMHATHYSPTKLQAVIDAIRARGLTVEANR